MSLTQIGAILLVLTVLVVFGNIWFNIVEVVLNKFKSLFVSNNNAQTWHEFPENTEKRKDK